MKKITFLVLSFSCLLAKPVVTTSILPNKFIIEQIAGDSVDIDVIIPIKTNADDYAMTVTQFRKLLKTDIFFANGSKFEDEWLEEIKHFDNNLTIVDISSGVDKIGENIFLDPIALKIQAKNIADALSKKYPDMSGIYAINLKLFNGEIDRLDDDIKENLSEIKNRKFLTYTPTWQDFAKRYELTEIPLKANDGEVTEEELNALKQRAKDENIMLIIISPTSSQKEAFEVSIESGAKIQEVDEMSENVTQNLNKFSKTLQKHLK